jgi:hypothetical protein
MKVRLAVCSLVILLGLAGSVSARTLTPRKSMVWAGLNGNRSPLVESTTGSGNEFESSELGLHLAYSFALSQDWTVVASYGFDVGSHQFKPTTGPTTRFSIDSWNVRLGADRYAFINDTVALYAGPGILYWRGKSEVDGSGNPALDREWPTVREIAFNGRIGMLAYLGERYALFGHIGQVIGSNSAEDGNGRNTWWTSHHEGSVGLSVDL